MRLKRLRGRLPFLLTVGAIISVIALYVFGLSWLQSRHYAWVEYDELIAPRATDALIFVWLFWFASSIGSFLNVVAWRMPRGESVNGRSRCPRCEQTLKPRDNFPVFGWIALRGRCRSCRLPISPRYPIVEAAVGISLTLIGIAELYRLAIPHQAIGHSHFDPLWTPRVDRVTLMVLVYHVVVVATSWAFGLVRLDRSSLPWRLVAVGMTLAIIPMLVFPTLMIVPWQTQRPDGWYPDGMYIDAVMRILTALVAAAVFARMLARGLCPTADPKLDPLGRGTTRLVDLIVILTLPAIVVGWQALPAVIVLAALIAILLRRIRSISTDTFGCFALATPIALTIQMLLWRRLHASTYWPSDETSHWTIFVFAAVVLVLPAWLREPPEPVVPVAPPSDDGDEDVDDDEDVEDEEVEDSDEVQNVSSEHTGHSGANEPSGEESDTDAS